MIGNDDDGNGKLLLMTLQSQVTSRPNTENSTNLKEMVSIKNLNLESWHKKYKILMILMLECLVNTREIKRRERNKYEGNDLNC